MSTRVGKIYFCPVCGNEIEFKRDGGGQIFCCNQEMRIKKEGFNHEE